MPSVRDSLRNLVRRNDPPAPAVNLGPPPGPPHVAVGEGHQTSRFARMAAAIRQTVTDASNTVDRRVNQVIARAERTATHIGQQAQNARTQAADLAQRAGTQAADLAQRAGTQASDLAQRARTQATAAKDAVAEFGSKTVVPGAAMGAKTVGGFFAAPIAGYLERKNDIREAKAEARFRAENADVIAALSRAPENSIADRPGVRELLQQDIQRNAHGHPRISGDEAVQMARMGQHIAKALADGATLNPNGNLPVKIGDATHEVKPGAFASRALAWHMTAAAANNTLLRQQQNPGQDVASDVTNSGTFVMKDPGGHIYEFLNANPQVEGRVSTHFADRIDNNDKILLGKKALQRGYDDFQGKLPGQGGALLFDKMKNGELFMKVEHAGCPGIFAREEHHKVKDIAVRAPLALNRWYEHTKSLVASGNANAVPDPNKIVRQEHIDKGMLRPTISEPLQEALAMAEAAGTISRDESERLYSGARNQGLQQVEKVTNFLRGTAEGIQSDSLKNLLNTKLDEISTNVQTARQQLDSLEQYPELGLQGIDRRGAEVHVSLNPDHNPANLPGYPVGAPPVVAAPVVAAPVVAAPVVAAPVVAAPLVAAPVVAAPVVAAPVVAAPVGPAPVVAAPVGPAPVGPAPVGPAPVGPAPVGVAGIPPVAPSPAVQQPAITGVKELQAGKNGVVFKVDFNDGNSQVVKLQNTSAVSAIVGSSMVQQAGVHAPKIERIGPKGSDARASLAEELKQLGSADATKLAGHLRSKEYSEAITMEFAPGRDIGQAVKQPDFKNEVLLNPRFQEQLGRLMAADAVAGNPDRVAAINPNSNFQGFYNEGNMKIHGAGEDLNIIAIDNEFRPGMNMTGFVSSITDNSVFGVHSGVIQIGSMAAASPQLYEKEAGLVLDRLCSDANVQLTPAERQDFINNAQKGAANAMKDLLQPGQHRQQQLAEQGVDQRDIDKFSKQKRGLRMLAQDAPAEGAQLTIGDKDKLAAGGDLSVGDKLKLAAGSDKEHKQNYRAYLGKEAKENDKPEVTTDVARVRRR